MHKMRWVRYVAVGNDASWRALASSDVLWRIMPLKDECKMIGNRWFQASFYAFYHLDGDPTVSSQSMWLLSFVRKVTKACVHEEVCQIVGHTITFPFWVLYLVCEGQMLYEVYVICFCIQRLLLLLLPSLQTIACEMLNFRVLDKWEGASVIFVLYLRYFWMFKLICNIPPSPWVKRETLRPPI